MDFNGYYKNMLINTKKKIIINIVKMEIYMEFMYVLVKVLNLILKIKVI